MCYKLFYERLEQVLDYYLDLSVYVSHLFFFLIAQEKCWLEINGKTVLSMLKVSMSVV